MAMLSAAIEAARTGPGVKPSDCDVAAKLTDPPTYEAHRAEATCRPTQQRYMLMDSKRFLLQSQTIQSNSTTEGCMPCYRLEPFRGSHSQQQCSAGAALWLAAEGGKVVEYAFSSPGNLVAAVHV